MYYYKLLNYITSVYTPIKYRQELIRKWFLSFIPSYFYKVIYISDKCDEYDEIYNYNEHREFNKLNDYSFKEGYYAFVFWNNDKNTKEKLILHSSHIKKALHIDSLKYLYAFDEHSMIQILLNYVKTHIETTILDININGVDVYNSLKGYVSSFEISKNVTPRVMQLLLHLEEDINELFDIDSSIKVTCFTVIMEDIVKENDEFLIE